MRTVKRLVKMFGVVLAVLMLLTPLQAAAEMQTMPDGASFDPAFYAAAYPDVKAAFGESPDWLYFHYTNCGWTEKRLPYAGADPAQIPMPEKQPLPQGGVPGAPRQAIDPTKPMVALTFDDGPGAYDGRILDCLEAAGGKATFFLVGTMIPYRRDTVRRIQELGMELGNHTYNHPVLSRLSAAGVEQEIRRTNEELVRTCGQQATVFRAPYGDTGGAVRSTAASLGYGTIFWSIDTEDWRTRNTQAIVRSVLGKVRDGDIILMHSTCEATAAAVEIIVPELLRSGYQLVTVSEMAALRSGMTPGGNYTAFRPGR